FCDRRVTVARKDIAPVWTRSFPIAKEPTTLGQHLKKKRFLAGIRQREAAVKLVSGRKLVFSKMSWDAERLGRARRAEISFMPLRLPKISGDKDTAPVGLGGGLYFGGVRPPGRACRRARVDARAIPGR